MKKAWVLGAAVLLAVCNPPVAAAAGKRTAPVAEATSWAEFEAAAVSEAMAEAEATAVSDAMVEAEAVDVSDATAEAMDVSDATVEVLDVDVSEATVEAEAEVEDAAAPAIEATDEVTTADSPSAAPAFVDQVWKVSASPEIEVGSIFAWLSDGTLVIDAPNDPLLLGTWTYVDGQLTMTEEGQSYPVDIVTHGPTRLHLRMLRMIGGVGDLFDITLVPAPEVTLPSTAKR